MSTAQHDIVLRMLADVSQYAQQMNRSRSIAAQTASAIGSAFSSMRRTIEVAFGVMGGNALLGGIRNATGGMMGLVTSSLGLASGVETAQTQFAIMLGDARLARNIFLDLKKYADTTQFHAPEIMGVARTLMAQGVKPGQIMPTIKRLGDISFNSDMLQQNAELYGKIYGMGRITAHELRQFASTGVPIFQEMAKVMGVSGEELRKMVTQGMITFPIFAQALKNLTDQGGMFYQMQQRISQTSGGLWSTLVDAWNNIKISIGNALFQCFDLNEIMRIATEVAGVVSTKIQEWTPWLKQAVAELMQNWRPMLFNALGDVQIFAGRTMIWIDGIRSGFVELIAGVREFGKQLEDAIPDVVKFAYNTGAGAWGAAKRTSAGVGDALYGFMSGESIGQTAMRTQAREGADARGPGGGGTAAAQQSWLSNVGNWLVNSSGYTRAFGGPQGAAMLEQARQQARAMGANRGSGQPEALYDPTAYVKPAAKAAKSHGGNADFWTGGFGSVGGGSKFSEASKGLEALWKTSQEEQLDALHDLGDKLDTTNAILGGV